MCYISLQGLDKCESDVILYKMENCLEGRDSNMAREARKKSSTGIYHILIRTGDRLFLNDDDREQFCLLLEKYFSDEAVLYGIRISDRKIHLIADEKDGEIAKVIKPFCTSYARYYNRVHSVNGKLFEGRFKSEPIESDEALLSVAAYLYRDRKDEFGNESYITKNNKIKLDKATAIPVMDDYENMSNEELLSVISYIMPDAENLTDEKKLEAVMNANVDSRIRIGLIKKALGLSMDIKPACAKKAPVKNKPAVKKVNKAEPQKKTEIIKEKIIEEKQENKENTQKKKELSVWLL